MSSTADTEENNILVICCIHSKWKNTEYYLSHYLFIEHVALAEPGDNALGSVRLSVLKLTLSRLNRLTFDLDF